MSYDTITVSAGEEYFKSMSEGEVWENVLIDITADRASFRMNAQLGGSGCTIRNIGVRGQFHSDDYSGNMLPISAQDPGTEITVENFYFGDGCENSPGPAEDPSAISVRPSHEGRIDFRYMTLREFPDNAFYSSPAGHWDDHPSGPGGGGEVYYYGCYAEDCQTSDFRPGTDGVIENCAGYGNPHRGIWANQHIDEGGYQTVRNVHIGSGGSRAIAIGNNNWDGGETNGLVLENDVNIDGGIDLYNSGNWYDGEVAGTAEYHPPSHFGAPESAEEAASGEPPEPIEVGHIDDDFAHEDLAANYQGDLDGFDILGGEL